MDQTTIYIPQILEYSPTEFSSSVSRQPEIKAVFTLDMKVGGLTGAEADTYLNRYATLVNRVTDEHFQLAVVSYSKRTRTLTFSPTTELDPGADYTVSILSGFEAASGRGTVGDASWKFTVSETAVPSVTLAGPIHAAEVTSIPIISWDSVPASGANYRVQVSSLADFSSTIYDTELAATYVDSLSSENITTDVTYYWRVRASSGTVTGAWSEIRSFRVKSVASQAVSASLFDSFGLVSYYPPDGASNLSSWPSGIRMTFSGVVDPNTAASGIVVIAESVDTGQAATTPSMSLSVSGQNVAATLSGTIENNTRYKISVIDVASTGGLVVANPTSFTFTGPYLPLYATSATIRGDYGRFLLRYTDDEINYQAHRASIKCNRIVASDGSLPITSYLTTSTVTFDMEAYVVAYTAYCLIQSYLFEVMSEAGRRNQLDTLMSATDARLIEDIQGVLEKLEQEVKRFEITLGGAPSPVAGVRSSQWGPSSLYEDMSVGNLGRAKF
jgi:hypothetical protein